MLRFAQPYYFLLLPLICAAAWIMYRRGIKRGLIFAALPYVPSARGTWRIRTTQLAPVLYITALILIMIALARPQRVLSTSRRNVDALAIEMVVDVSGSMEALDLSLRTPLGTDYRSRLDAVKKTFAEFVEKRPDDLIGLVTFGGYASTRAPLTIDHAALTHVLKGVEIPAPRQDDAGNIVDQEELLTAIGDALVTACARLKDTEPQSRIIVLLSDGESNTGIITPLEAMNVARKMGIKVYTIGIGTTGRAPFWGRDMFGRKVIQHAPVSLDEDLLRKIARDTGGRYFNVRDPKGLQQAMEDINQLETTSVEQNVYHQYDELFLNLLIAALIMIITGTGLNTLLSGKII